MTEPQAVALAKKFRDAYNDFEVDQPETLELRSHSPRSSEMLTTISKSTSRRPWNSSLMM